MVYVDFEKTLSTCENPELYRALWKISAMKNKSLKILENESIPSICNQLLDYIMHETLDASNFVISTNLVYGTVCLYKAQIDKLCDQSKFALQSCNSTFNYTNWFTDMTQPTSTPITNAGKSAKKKVAKKSVSHKERSKSGMFEDESDNLEKVFTVEIENDDFLNTIDPTTARNTLEITLKEPVVFQAHLITSINADFEEFGDETDNEFATFMRESNPFKRPAEETNHEVLMKKRRLSYMTFNDTIEPQRNATNVPNVDVYNFSEHLSPYVSRSFDRNEITKISLDNAQNYFGDCEPTIPNHDHQPMEVEQEPSVPIATLDSVFDCDHNPFAFGGRSMNLNPQTNSAVPEMPADSMEVDENMPSQLILEELPKTVGHKTKKRATKHLVIDKQKILEKELICKTMHKYKDKMTKDSPFKEFMEQIHLAKSSSDILFSSGSTRLKKSKLHFLYVRNLKKVSNKPNKKKTENMKENQPVDSENMPEGKRSKRPSRNCNILKESNSAAIPDDDIVMLPVKQETFIKNGQSTKIPSESNAAAILDGDIVMREDDQKINSTKRSPHERKIINDDDIFFLPIDRSSFLGENNGKTPIQSEKLSKIRKESTINNILLDDDINMPLVPLEKNSNAHEMYEHGNIFDLPTAAQALNASTKQCGDEDASRKRIVLLKLNHFWLKGQKVTMNELCAGVQQTEAIGYFFELLLLQKNNIIELVTEGQSLEITNILCKISFAQLAHEIEN